MHVYQMRSSVQSVVAASQERINICMSALKEISKVWLVARMVHTLFDSILGNKVLEERLQKAAGKRHQKRTPAASVAPKPQPDQAQGKRKFDDMEFGYSSGPPAPQLSYERSRPQTPSLTPSRELNQHQNVGGMASPPVKNAAEQFLPPGASRGDTRHTSPFPGFSIPATPPDLFLVTRNSPSISQSLWENFQPDQLFPDGTNMAMPFSSPNGNAVDPQLSMPQAMPGAQQVMAGDSSGVQMTPGLAVPQFNMGMPNQGWSVDPMISQGLDNQDDNWSNSSVSVPIVPPTLNVEDW